MSTIFVEPHRDWRGLSAARDVIFCAVVVLGFVTIGVYRGSLIDRLTRMRLAGGGK